MVDTAADIQVITATLESASSKLNKVVEALNGYNAYVEGKGRHDKSRLTTVSNAVAGKYSRAVGDLDDLADNPRLATWFRSYVDEYGQVLDDLKQRKALLGEASAIQKAPGAAVRAARIALERFSELKNALISEAEKIRRAAA